MKERLQTRDRLHILGISQSELCCICNNMKEDSNHLFFKCNFSRQVLKEVKGWLAIGTTANTLPHMLAWIRRRAKGGKFRRHILIASMLATVYNI